jgi:hypothetical protein
MRRSESKRALLHGLGAEPVVAEAVARARPEVIVHQLTAIGSLDPRHFDRDFALTNRLRTEGPLCDVYQVSRNRNPPRRDDDIDG